MDLSKDFRDLLELFNGLEVRYLAVGGYAASIYAEPRYTKDLDLWVGIESENARKILEALKAFGFGSVGLSEEDFTRPDHVVQLGRPPNRVDLLTSLKGLSFDECFPRRNVVWLGGVQVPFLAVEDLIVNKRAVGRLRDLADVEDILRHQS